MKKLLFILSFLTLAACGSVNDVLRDGYGTTELSKRINISLLNKDVITAQTGQEIQDKTKAAESALDAAFQIRDINRDEARTAAEKALDTAQEVLDTLTGYANGGVE